MYCPNCGAKALEEQQRFCKTCGTNLELVAGSLKEGEDTLGQLRLDMESLKTGLRDFSKGIGKVGIHYGYNERSSRERRREERRPEPRQPKPKEWLAYTWQHNLKNGLISLFGGAGLGIVLFYLSQIAINEGVIRSIEEGADGRIHGLEPLARWIWLFALIPILKGLAQIIYAAFAGNSITKVAERFAPPQPAQTFVEPPQPLSAVPKTDGLPDAPPSVTENTTKFFDPVAQPGRESQ